MLTVYGIQSCGTCREMRAAFDKAGVPYVYKNFSENIQNLKDFLKLRDSLPLFDEVKARGGVGTPCLVSDDGKVTLDGEQFLPAGFPMEERNACSRDGKSC